MALFDVDEAHDLPREPFWRGELRGLGTDKPMLHTSTQPGQPRPVDSSSGMVALQEVGLAAMIEAMQGRHLLSIAHRVVHGGPRHARPLRLDTDALTELRTLVPLAPLHQAPALDAAERCLARWPHVAQWACFDTAFHSSLPLEEQLLPLPWRFHEQGIRRYGFHGLSYEYQSIALAERHGGLANWPCIVAHLGSGASLCAMRDGRSVATSMGFSALDGLMMGTRCGSLDPGVLLYLLQCEGMRPAQLSDLLYHDAGLKGLSGRSADPRDLLAHEADDPRAAAALALYVQRIVREIGALAAVLGGVDLLVFTGGIGEHQAQIRARIVARLAHMGMALDAEANERHASVISSALSRVRVCVEPTNEEWVAARHALAATAQEDGVLMA